jgi:hypothetical protein
MLGVHAGGQRLAQWLLHKLYFGVCVCSAWEPCLLHAAAFFFKEVPQILLHISQLYLFHELRSFAGG